MTGTEAKATGVSKFSRAHRDTSVVGWTAAGLCGYALLPWYFLQNGSLWSAMPGLFATPDFASGIVQAAAFGHDALWLVGLGFIAALLAGLFVRGRTRGGWLVLAAVAGIVGVFANDLGTADAVAPMQTGLGWGGFAALVAFVMLLGSGLARLGMFRGDMFIACAVTGFSALLILFVAYPRRLGARRRCRFSRSNGG